MKATLIILFILNILLKERVFLPIAFFGREVPLFEFPFLVVAALVFVREIRQLSVSIIRKEFLLWTPYFALGVILPIAGVVFLSYPLTTLYGVVTVVVNPLAAVIVGFVVFRSQSERLMKLVNICINGGMLVQATFAVLQLLRILGYSNTLVDSVTMWDIESQSRIKEEYVIIGRSIGTFINPNVLGVWCLITFFWNLFQSKGLIRLFFSSVAIITLVLTQSRGSTMGLFAGLLMYFIRLAILQQREQPEIRMTTLIGLGSVAVTIAFALALVSPSFSLLPGSERWRGGVEVITRGVAADANFATRVQVWRESISFLDEYPLGTWGPPQVKFILPPDNLYVHTLLQGSIFYLSSLLVGFIGSASFLFSMRRAALLFSIVSISMAANSVSALPLLYPPGLLYWYLLGCLIADTSIQQAMEPT